MAWWASWQSRHAAAPGEGASVTGSVWHSPHARDACAECWKTAVRTVGWPLPTATASSTWRGRPVSSGSWQLTHRLEAGA
jgi:hypothetical protein